MRVACMRLRLLLTVICVLCSGSRGGDEAPEFLDDDYEAR